ncbi:MAG TPA: hypothetical protein VFY34_18580, partial [Pyrinomonadaceae bacterium]|nr:hypothetical protein [Pyrinomonadaceae bacterium]
KLAEGDFMRAPLRFRPRIKRRIGFTVWLDHQDGGSTFVTDGAPWPRALVKKRLISSEETKAARGKCPAPI